MSATEPASHDGIAEEKPQLSFRDWKKQKEAENQSNSTTNETTSKKNDSSKNDNVTARSGRYMENMRKHYGDNNNYNRGRSLFNAGNGFNPQSLFNSNYTNFSMPQSKNFNSAFVMQPLLSAMQQNHMYGVRQPFPNTQSRDRNQRGNFRNNDFNTKTNGFKKGATMKNNIASETKELTPLVKDIKPKEIAENTTTQKSIGEELSTKPQIFVARKVPSNEKYVNGRKRINWIQKPERPPPINAVTPESKEEKQRLWREYRQAVKPLKNREFHNAKRTIQRLGKRNPAELDEKELFRLQRAQEFVAAHKAKISQRAATRWVQVQDARTTAKEANATLEAPVITPQVAVAPPEITPPATTVPNTQNTSTPMWNEFYGYGGNLYQHWPAYNNSNMVNNQAYAPTNFMPGVVNNDSQPVNSL